MIERVKQLFAVWIEAVAAALAAIGGRITPQRRVLCTAGQGTDVTLQAADGPKLPSLPEITVSIADGTAAPSLPEDWRSALRGSRVELRLRSDQVLLRPVTFPRQASDFLAGMIRAQIDRLTPWTAEEAVFGWSAPQPAPGERITTTLAATSGGVVNPLIAVAAALGARSVVASVELGSGERREKVTLLERRLQGGNVWRVDVPLVLRHGLLVLALASVITMGVTGFVGGAIDADRQEIAQQVARQRASLRLSQRGGSAETLLARRKQSTPASVLVLEAISRVLPDGTYVTELRIDGDKVQVVGMTRDAPSLIRLMEQSPQFTRATFFAPTTRAQNEPGERFHIEAHITPHFGSGS